MKKLGWVVTGFIVTAAIAIFNGYALSVLWSWFIVSTFGLVVLTIPQAIGLCLTVSFMTKRIDPDRAKNKDFKECFKLDVLTGLLKPIIALTFGWLVMQFM